MKNSNTTANVGPEVAAVFLFQLTRSVITKKTATPVYCVDECRIHGDNVDVDFTVNDAWAETTISLSDLKRFVVNKGLNDYCFDRSINWEHVQDSGSFDLDTFIDENLSYAVLAYLRSNDRSKC